MFVVDLAPGRTNWSQPKCRRHVELATMLCVWTAHLYVTDGGSLWSVIADSPYRETGYESHLLLFRSLGIFCRSTAPQFTQLYK